MILLAPVKGSKEGNMTKPRVEKIKIKYLALKREIELYAETILGT